MNDDTVLRILDFHISHFLSHSDMYILAITGVILYDILRVLIFLFVCEKTGTILTILY